MAIDWNASLLRMSAFSSASQVISEADWTALTGQDEANRRVAIPGGKRFSGESSGGVLSLAYSGQRLDLVLEAPTPGTAVPELPIVGPWAETQETFGHLSLQLLKSLKVPITRIAFGGTLLAQRDSVESSYEQLGKFLKSVQVNPEKMRDLLYRVNWSTTAKVVPLRLNRLTSWTTLRFTTKVIGLTGDNVTLAEGEVGERFAVRLEFDNNTDAANEQAFDPNKVGPIFRELVDLAAENAEYGEIVS